MQTAWFKPALASKQQEAIAHNNTQRPKSPSPAFELHLDRSKTPSPTNFDQTITTNVIVSADSDAKKMKKQ